MRETKYRPLKKQRFGGVVCNSYFLRVQSGITKEIMRIKQVIQVYIRPFLGKSTTCHGVCVQSESSKGAVLPLQSWARLSAAALRSQCILSCMDKD